MKIYPQLVRRDFFTQPGSDYGPCKLLDFELEPGVDCALCRDLEIVHDCDHWGVYTPCKSSILAYKNI